MKLLPWIVTLVLIVAAFIVKCDGGKVDTRALQEKSDSLNWALDALDERGKAIDTLRSASIKASQSTMEAYRKVDTLKTQLAKSQAYAAGLARGHWQAIKDNDTTAYMQNCDEMAGQLSDSRDSVHNLMAEINAYKFGVNGFQEAYTNELRLSDSLRRELFKINLAYSTIAKTAVAAFDSSITGIKKLNSPKVYLGVNVQAPFGVGPDLQLQTGNKIYSIGVLAGNHSIIYQVGAHIKLSFKKPSFHL